MQKRNNKKTTTTLKKKQMKNKRRTVQNKKANTTCNTNLRHTETKQTTENNKSLNHRNGPKAVR